MKKILFGLLSVLTLSVSAQAPGNINYQGVVRDGSGVPVTSLTSVGVKFEIGDGTNNIVHSETQLSVPVNSLGLFSTRIGLSPALSNTISWQNGPYTLSVSINTGTGFTFMGGQQFASVPYALYAKNAPVPSLSLNGNSLSLAGGNTVTLPAGSSYTSGTGISFSGSVISNSAPDQTVVLNNGTNVNVGGTYPVFTISSTPTLNLQGNQLNISGGNTVTLPTGVTYTSGTGISILNGSVITNTSPNQTVNVSGPQVIGAYPNFTVTAPPPVNITAGNSNINVLGAQPNFTISSSPTLNLSGNNLSISNGNTVTLSTGVTTLNTSPPLIGGPITSAGTISLAPSGVTSNSYGASPNVVPSFSVDQYGRLVSANNYTLSIPTNSLNGDVKGTFLSNTVTALQGFSISAVTPTAGQILTFTNSVWTPSTPPAVPLIPWVKTGTNVILGTTSDNVGVGSLSPAEKLQVESATATRASIISPSTSASALWFGHPTFHNKGVIEYNNSTDEMNFWTNNTNSRIRLFGNGDIAFGLATGANPTGFAFFSKPGPNDTKVVIAGGDNSNTYGGILTLAENINSFQGMSLRLDAGGNRLWITNDPNGNNPVVSIGGYSGANNGVAIGPGYAFSQAPVNGLMVQGNVGINTTAPSTNLHVNGTIRMTDGNEGANKFLISDGFGNASWQARNTNVTVITPPGCQSINSVSTTATLLANLGTFTKLSAGSAVEIDFSSFINVQDLIGAFGVVYELRVDGVAAASNAGKTVYFIDNGGSFIISSNQPANLNAVFMGLSTGAHTVGLYVFTNAGSAQSVFYDPGCWSTTNLTIKEFW